MSPFVAYILQFQEIIVYKIPPGGRGSIASLRSRDSRSDNFQNLESQILGLRGRGEICRYALAL